MGSLHRYGKRISFVTLVVLAMLCMSTAMGLVFKDASKEISTAIFLTQLVLLQISLAFVAPSNVSRLYQHKHVERSLVILEWAKAYAGRLLGPMVTLVMHNHFGLAPLIAMLFTSTFIVAATA